MFLLFFYKIIPHFTGSIITFFSLSILVSKIFCFHVLNTNPSLKVYTKILRKNHISKFLLEILYTF